MRDDGKYQWQSSLRDRCKRGHKLTPENRKPIGKASRNTGCVLCRQMRSNFIYMKGKFKEMGLEYTDSLEVHSVTYFKEHAQAGENNKNQKLA